MVSPLVEVFLAVDNGLLTLLSLYRYNISAAFDTADHTILLDRLTKSFGITDSALLWFQSILIQCMYQSRRHHVGCGDPLVETMPFNRRVVCSTPALAAT